MKTPTRFLFTLLCAAITSVQSIHATTITVTNTNNSGPGSLRQALVDANDGDTIDATGVFGTILLTSGELVVDKDVIISGPGANHLAVDGNAQSGVFYVNPGEGKKVTIDGLTVANGLSDYGGGIFNDGSDQAGGATLTITNCTVSGNSAGASGGGILTTGVNSGATLTITNCTVSGNSAGFYGGGIASGAGTSSPAFSLVTISNSTISGNSAGIGGGGIYNSGGGSSAALTVRNSTLSGNSATGNGDGIYNYEGGVSGVTLVLGSAILNAGGSGENIFNDGGTVKSLGYNVSSDNGGGYLTGPGDQLNINSMLGPLQDNGGPTFTHALLPNSPAINTGDPNFTSPADYDQRGPRFNRVVNGRIDVGSFEIQSAPTPTPRPWSTPRPRLTPQIRPTATQ